MKTLFTICSLFILCINLQAATVTWIGGTGDWDDPANWDNGIGVAYGDDAIIPTGSVTIQAGVNAEATSVHVESAGRLRVLVSGFLGLNSGIDISGLTVDGLAQIYGVVKISDFTHPGNSGADGNAIYCTGRIITYASSEIYIDNIENKGIYVTTTGRFYQYGYMSLTDIEYSGITNLNRFYNSGEIDINMSNIDPTAVGIYNGKYFRNYALGDISILYGNNGISNGSGGITATFKNWGSISTSYAAHSGLKNSDVFKNYSGSSLISFYHDYAGIHNSDLIINYGSVLTHSNALHGVFNFGTIKNHSIMNSYSNVDKDYYGRELSEFHNFDLFSCINEFIISSADFTNHNTGHTIIGGKITSSNSTILNENIFLANYNGSHSFLGGVNTFDNLGAVGDLYGYLATHINNLQIVVGPSSISLQDGVPVANLIDDVSSSNIIIGDWVTDPYSTDIAGSYDEVTNEFTPSSFAVGLSSIFVGLQTPAAAYGRLFEIKLSTPVAPLVAPFSNTPLINTDQEQLATSAPFKLTPYPNPTKDQFNINFNIPNEYINQALEISLTDQLGRVVSQEAVFSDLAKQYLEINIPDAASNGMYFIQLVAKEGIVAHGKIQVQRN